MNQDLSIQRPAALAMLIASSLLFAACGGSGSGGGGGGGGTGTVDPPSAINIAGTWRMCTANATGGYSRQDWKFTPGGTRNDRFNRVRGSDCTSDCSACVGRELTGASGDIMYVRSRTVNGVPSTEVDLFFDDGVTARYDLLGRDPLDASSLYFGLALSSSSGTSPADRPTMLDTTRPLRRQP